MSFLYVSKFAETQNLLGDRQPQRLQSLRQPPVLTAVLLGLHGTGGALDPQPGQHCLGGVGVGGAGEVGQAFARPFLRTSSGGPQFSQLVWVMQEQTSRRIECKLKQWGEYEK